VQKKLALVVSKADSNEAVHEEAMVSNLFLTRRGTGLQKVPCVAAPTNPNVVLDKQCTY